MSTLAVSSPQEFTRAQSTLRTYASRRVGFFFLNLGAFWFVLLWCGWGWTALAGASLCRGGRGASRAGPTRSRR